VSHYPSEINLICGFVAKETFLIIINVFFLLLKWLPKLHLLKKQKPFSVTE